MNSRRPSELMLKLVNPSRLVTRVLALRGSPSFQKSASNATLSIVEFLAQPLSMLLAARFLVNWLGLEQFGIWVLVSAILGSIGILSTGFGDATIKYVSAYRGRNDPAGVERTIRATLTINILLGTVFGLLIWLAAPISVHRLFKIDPIFYLPSVQAIRISAVILVIRSVESVFVSAQKAFEQYRQAVKLNVFLRIVVVVSAVFLASQGKGIVPIMWATLWWSALVVGLQVYAARGVAGSFRMLPTIQTDALREVFAFGCFSWLQSLAGVVFNYADRFILAALLGPAAIAVYVVCVQVAQPIHSLCAAAFNFLFPHLSARHGAGEKHAARRVFRLAGVLNVALALILGLPILVAAKPLLPLWMGHEFASKGYTTLLVLTVSYMILATSIVPHFGLLALGRVRLVAALNAISGVVLILVMFLLVPHFQLVGAGIGRLLYSLTATIPYWIFSQSAFNADRNSPEVPYPSSEVRIRRTEETAECAS
jgi:O-antigen/teichoic acid export membrane protein